MRGASLQGSAATLAARLAEISVGRPRATLAAAALGLGALLCGALRARSEVGYAAYFGPDSPEVAQLSAFLDEFESGFHLLIVFSCRETTRCHRIDEPWALDFLGRLHDAADQLPNVRRTWSALNAPISVGPLETRSLAQRGEEGARPATQGTSRWRLDPGWRELLATGRAQPSFAQSVVSLDGRSAGIVVELQSIASEPMRATVHGALAMLPAFERELGAELHLAGDPVWTVISADTLDRDSTRLTLLMFAVMLALLFALFRDPWLSVLPVLAVGAVTGAVRGLGVWLGLPQTSLLAALPPLLVVIAVAGSIHLLAAVQRLAATRAAAPAVVLVEAAHEVGPGCFWSTFTTAVGFGSFFWSDLRSFRDFGLLAAIGVAAGFVLTFTLLPALLSLRMRRGALRPHRSALSREILDAVSETVARYPRFVLCAALGGFALLGLGVLRLHYANDFGFGEGSFVVRSLRAIEANFRKPMTTEVLVTLPPERRVWDEQTLWLLDRIERIFSDEPSTGQVWSLLDLLEEAHRVDFGREPASFDALVQSAHREMALVASSERARWFWSEASAHPGGRGDQARVSVDRAWLDDAAQGPYVARVTADLAALQQQAGAVGYRVELAGGLVLADRFVRQLRDTQWRSFASAFAVIAGTLGLVLRGSPGLAVRAIAANVLPVVALVGLMGWAGVGIDPATAMVGAILLVLADDATIHLTLAYRDARASGHSAADAIALAIHGVGEPLLITGLCLALGFSVLLFSEWGGLVGFGLMASLGVVLLLAGGLLFLPASLLAQRMDHGRAAGL
ncbi:MAG TPA: MMPL family transporter [Myxococcota bacterium]|nr:MMPL family transporter [Myxococcota bacterium]